MKGPVFITDHAKVFRISDDYYAIIARENRRGTWQQIDVTRTDRCAIAYAEFLDTHRAERIHAVIEAEDRQFGENEFVSATAIGYAIAS